MTFTVGCAQFAPIKAQVPANLDKISDFTLQAFSEGVDLLLFPETSTSGYFVEGGALEVALSGEELTGELLKRVKDKLTGPIDVVVGFIERHGGILYNAAAYVELTPLSVRLVHTYRKFFLPTYGMFDEQRFVARGTHLGCFDTRFGRIGILICEDIWHAIMPTLLALHGAEVILVPAASPARNFREEQIENSARYARMLRASSEEHGVFSVNCQLCGFEGGKGFIGGSRIVDPFGETLAESPIQEEHLLIAELDMDLIPIKRAQYPLISDLRDAWGDVQRIIAQTPSEPR